MLQPVMRLTMAVARGVVVMMMRGEDMRERPALLMQRGEQLLGVGRIDRGGGLGCGSCSKTP